MHKFRIPLSFVDVFINKRSRFNIASYGFNIEREGAVARSAVMHRSRYRH